MSAKFIYSMTDENPDLHKQIGCMNGIFQLFDRHRFLSSRRINGHIHKGLPQGQNNQQAVQPNSPQQKVTEKNTKKVVKEKRRISTESSRTSFSSSSCSSSFSSVDYNRTTHIEHSQSSQTSFAETPTRDLLINKPNASKQSSRQSLNLRDAVKDSLHREVRGVSLKTATKDAVVQTLKYIDSPRPSQPQKSVKPRFSGLNVSLRVYEEKDGCTHSTPREIRRLSYDEKESRDMLKSTMKLKELPRLSLDSRERPVRGSTCEPKSNYLRKDLQQEKMNCNEMINLQQEPGSSKRPSSFIVAKLMGLETFPESTSTHNDSLRLTSTCQTDKYDPLARSSRASNENRTDPFSGSSRNSHKAAASLQMKNADAVTKATFSQKFPIESAPWRNPHGSRSSQSPAFKCQEAPTKTTNSSPSVYGEIEKRLAELEFKTSAKDLRALKQILEAMQKTKEILDDKKDQTSNFVAQMSNNSSLDHSTKLAIQSNLQSSISNSPKAKASKSPKSYKSPIVIMKPAKLVGKNIDPTSTVSSNNNLFGLPKLQTNDLAENRKNDANKRTAKSVTPKRTYIANPINQHHSSMDKIPTTQTSKMPQNSREDKGASSGKTSGTSSPRLQHRRFVMDRQACLPSPDPTKTRRQQSRQPIESGSPGRKYRPKSPNPQRSNDHLCESTTNIRTLSQQDDDSSLQSESNASNRDNEVTSIIQPPKTHDTYFKHKQKQKNPAARLSENRTTAEPAKVISEQPSPVSVLDAAFYRDDSPSPVKKKSNAFKDDDALYADEVEWATEAPAQAYMSIKSSLSKEIDHKISQDISLLVQNPQQLNCIYKESIMCSSELHYDSTNPDHIYILDILSASGLLRNLDLGLTNIQSQPSDKLINPSLFLELEQIKESTQILCNEEASKTLLQPIPVQKTKRKLVFDVVNEIVVRKLVVQDSFKQWFSPEKLGGRKPRGQQLLRELCSEVDRLQSNNSNRNQDDEDDNLGSILCEDMMHWLLNWTECSSEIPALVLDIERLIFKDLITEVVSGDAAGLQGHTGGHRRQLFSK
ncbi:protein LONGIFOLIA 1 [Ziziphus jujuba]|uniref:Protein LONGIFOLIA 1 n=1 Tax=Ziziphus jujuba TaxID=326968 RepID=A0ABM3IGJ3_ZIZJJ|nr:protein LONGIFOLIA 1 [Ziziphus jujuba]